MITQRLSSLARGARRSIAFTLFAMCFATYAYFYQAGGQNESSRFDGIRAFIDNGNAVVDPWAQNSSDLIPINGHYYSGKAPGTFVLGLAPFWLSDEALSLFGVEPDFRYHWVTYITCVLSISFLGALGVVLLYWLGLRLGAERADAAAVALTIGLGTSYFPFATLFFSHVAAACCNFFAFYQLFSFRQDVWRNLTDHGAIRTELATKTNSSRWRLLLAGISFGFAIGLEYPAVIAVVLIGAYFAFFAWKRGRDGARALARVAVGGVIGLVPLFVYNTLVFKNPFYVTYEAYAKDANSAFTAHRAGILGIRVPLWDWSAWPQFFSNLSEITYKPLRGLFFNNPIFVLIFVGFALFALPGTRKKIRLQAGPEAWLALAVFSAYLSFNACFGDSITYWGGGASFGPRHVIMAFAFLAIPLLACLQHHRARVAFFPLAFLSTFLCLMATAVDPRTGYGPENPVFYFYLPRFLTGLLAINPTGVFSNAPLTINSVAFNWGKLAGLPLSMQLLPLYAIWLLALRRLDRQLQLRERGFLFAGGIFIFLIACAQIGALA